MNYVKFMESNPPDSFIVFWWLLFSMLQDYKMLRYMLQDLWFFFVSGRKADAN